MARTAALLACLSAPVLVAADEMVERARTLYQSGEAGQAYELLAPLEPDRAGDPEFDFMLGIAALDSGHATEAVFALERVLAVEPDNALARAEIARAFVSLNEVENARRQFATVREASIPPEARATIDRYLAALRTAPPGRSGKELRAFIAAGVGYDSNIAASATAIGIDTSRVGGLIPEQSSAFARFSGGASGRFPIRPNLAILGAANGFAKVNAKDADVSVAGGSSAAGLQQDFDNFDINGMVGLEYLRGDGAVSVVAQGDHFRLGDDAFRNVFGGTLQYRHRMSPVSHTTAYFQYARLTYHNQSFRNVNRWGGGMSYARIFPGKLSPLGYLGAYAGTEAQLASGRPDQGHDFWGLRFGGTIRPGKKVSASVSMNYEYRSYHGDDQLFAAITTIVNGTPTLIRRTEDRLFVRLAVDIEAMPFWFVTPSWEYNMADSTLPTTDFDRNVLMLTVRRDFE